MSQQEDLLREIGAATSSDAPDRISDWFTEDSSVLTQTDSTGQRSSLTRMASADVVQIKGLGLALCPAR